MNIELQHISIKPARIVRHQLRERIKGAVVACRRFGQTHIRPFKFSVFLKYIQSNESTIIFYCWQEKCLCDNTEEFWVEVRTTGSSAYQETLSEKETHTSKAVSAAARLLLHEFDCMTATLKLLCLMSTAFSLGWRGNDERSKCPW